MSKRNQGPTRDLLRVADAARRLAVSRRFIWQLLAAGQLTPIRLGTRCTRIDAAEVEALLEAARQKAKR
jgi:excisionase family DNA binding protein